MERKEYSFDKNKTYTFEEVRPIFIQMLKERARYLGLFYKHMPKELFDEVAKKALFEYGALKEIHGEKGKVETQANFLIKAFQSIGSTIGKGAVVSMTEDKAVFTMHDGCALVDAWREMGFSDAEVDYLCKIASYGDYGQADSLGLKATFTCTMTDKDCDFCELVVEKK